MFISLLLASMLVNADELYVINQAAATVIVIDERTGERQETIAVPPGPVGLAFSGDGSRAYVTHPEQGQVSVIDTAQRQVLRSIDVGGMPFGIAVDEGTHRRLLLVTDWQRNALVFVDPQRGAVIDLLATGDAPTGIAVDERNRRLYVANRDSGTITVLSADTPELFATIEAGRAPYALQLSASGGRLYVADPGGNEVLTIDTSSHAVSGHGEVGHAPYALALTPDEQRLLVTSQGDDMLSILAPDRDLEKLAGIEVGRDPEGVAVASNGQRAWVANWFDETLSLIDLETYEELRRIACDPGCRTIVPVPHQDEAGS
ncbi:YncE family protein [Methylohalomonas lacus]|nr:YncE family protein [Methylohalomonas lacus]